MSAPDGPSPSGPIAGLLTKRGWALLSLAGVLTVGGFLVHIDELFPVAVAAAALVVGALAWVRVRPWKVEGRRIVSPTRVAQGGTAQAEMTVVNLDARPSPVLAARDPFDGGARSARFAVSPIAPGASVTTRYRLPTSQRGMFTLGPLEFRLSDPFGLAAVNRRSGRPSSLRVYPAFERLAPLTLRGAVREDTSEGRARLTQGGDEFYALRDYQSGDDLRRVHWSSSARADRLMVRQDHELARSRLLVVGDRRSSVHTPHSFERLLEVLASLTDAGIRGGHSVRLVLGGGLDSQWGDGLSHATVVLDLLAAATVDPTDPSATLARMAWEHAHGSSAVIVTTDGAGRADLARHGPRGRDPDPLVVIIDREQGPAAPGDPLPRTVTVPVGVPFTAAWSRRS